MISRFQGEGKKWEFFPCLPLWRRFNWISSDDATLYPFAWSSKWKMKLRLPALAPGIVFFSFVLIACVFSVFTYVCWWWLHLKGWRHLTCVGEIRILLISQWADSQLNALLQNYTFSELRKSARGCKERVRYISQLSLDPGFGWSRAESWDQEARIHFRWNILCWLCKKACSRKKWGYVNLSRNCFIGKVQ